MPAKEKPAQAIAKAPSPWERQLDEGSKPFTAFCVYLELGQDRTLAKVGIRLGRSATLVERWSSKFHWADRLRAFEEHFAAIRRESEEKAIKLANVDWGLRLVLHREAIYNDAQLLRQKAHEILQMSSAKATVNDGVRALSLASELERVAMNLPPASAEQTGGMAISNSTVLVQFPPNYRDKPKPIESVPIPSQLPPAIVETPANAGDSDLRRRDSDPLP